MPKLSRLSSTRETARYELLSSDYARGLVSGSGFEQEITRDLPANTQFLSPRLFMNNGATAAAVAYDCSGVYVETDF